MTPRMVGRMGDSRRCPPARFLIRHAVASIYIALGVKSRRKRLRSKGETADWRMLQSVVRRGHDMSKVSQEVELDRPSEIMKSVMGEF